MRQPPERSDKQLQPLAPLPIHFDEERHRYTWLPTNEALRLSVTRVLGVSKTKQQLSTFERTKHIWAPRGTHVHWCLEQFLLGAKQPEELLGGDYDDYIEPLLAYPYWDTFEPIALEYRVCDLKKNIGGSLDVLGFDHHRQEMVLMDLKTLGRSSKPYSTDAQLGGYLAMLTDHHPTLWIDSCLTMWAGAGECHLGNAQKPEQCLEKWLDAYDVWKMYQGEEI